MQDPPNGQDPGSLTALGHPCEAGDSEEESRCSGIHRDQSPEESFSCLSCMTLDKLLNSPQPWFLRM